MSKDKTILEYLDCYHPYISKEYRRYLNRVVLPKIGDTIGSLRDGFGGYAGQILTIESIDGDYITLINQNGNRYISTIEHWWTEIEVRKEESECQQKTV